MRAIEERKPPRRQSKADLTKALLERLQKWQDEGDTPEEAVERLTLKQYDFLVDQGVNLDNLILTLEQQKAISAITKAPRSRKPGGYDKKYPPEKIALYTAFCELVTSLGAEIHPREKQNFRNLDFTLDGIRYEVVLSNPRTKK